MNEPRELVFFTDRDLGRQLPSTLRAAGIRVERHDDHFGVETPDDEWIAEIGRLVLAMLTIVDWRAQIAARLPQDRRAPHRQI